MRLRQRPGHRPAVTTSEWLDRLAPKATAIVAVGTCATYGGIHAMAGNPTGAMGVPDYLGWEWKSKAGIPIVCVPGCPIQPDNLSETLTYLLYMATGQAPMIPLDDALRPTWLFGQTVHEGCDRAGYYEQADFATEYGSPKCIVKLGCWGPVGEVQCAKTRLDERDRRLPQRRWHLHRLHDARVPRQVHAVHGRATGRQTLDQRRRPLRFGDPPTTSHHHADARHRSRSGASGGRNSSRVPPAPGSWASPDPARHSTERRRMTSTTERPAPARVPAATRAPGRDGLGSHHPHRRQPRDLHEDRLQAEGRRGVPQHQLDLPRLLDLHEGQGPSRRPLHHQPHLRHLRGQPRHLLLLRPEHGVRRAAAAPR